MAKDTFYFQHDYNARNDDKIMEIRSEFGLEAYGLFWMILEVMAENENGGVKTSLIGGLSVGFGVAKDRLLLFINFCVKIDLFYEDSGFLFSKRMLHHKDYRKLLSDAGRAGAEKMWGGRRGANGIPNAKERKGKEIIRGISFSEDKTVCLLSDNTQQQLTLDQLRRVKEGGFEPHYVKKGDKD